MIVYGYNSDTAVIGDAGKMHCPACKEEAGATAVVTYRYFHIWWLFSFVAGRKYGLLCDQCGSIHGVTKSELAEHIYPFKESIPFIRRWGAALVILAVVAFLAYGLVVSMAESGRKNQLIAAPRVGDLYLAELIHIPGSGYGPADVADLGGKGFGGMKLVEITEDERIFATTMMIWSSKKSLDKYLAGDELAYDMDDLVELPARAVEIMGKNGTIFEVRRPAKGD